MGPDAMICFFESWVLIQLFSLSSFKRLKFLFTFSHKGGVICISEVIDFSPGILDSSLSFIQLFIHMMYSAYKLNEKGGNIQP